VRKPGWDIEGSAADRLVWELLIYVIKVIFSGSHINYDQVITLAQSIKWQQMLFSCEHDPFTNNSNKESVTSIRCFASTDGWSGGLRRTAPLFPLFLNHLINSFQWTRTGC